MPRSLLLSGIGEERAAFPFHCYAVGMIRRIDLDHGQRDDSSDTSAPLYSLPIIVLASVGPMRHEVNVPFHDSQVKGKAVLIQTGWDVRWGTEAYWEPGPFLSDELIFRLVRSGVGVVGVDFWITGKRQTDVIPQFHHALLELAQRRLHRAGNRAAVGDLLRLAHITHDDFLARLEPLLEFGCRYAFSRHDDYYKAGGDMLRHTLAALAYRGGKTVRDVGPKFGNFRAGPSTRTPLEILAHIGDLLDWAVCLSDGKKTFHESSPLPWDKEVERFFAALETLDRRLAADTPLGFPVEQIFQGPIADALTHVGQIAMLRRIAGSPVRGENYFMAEIVAGRIGPKQSAPRREFD